MAKQTKARIVTKKKQWVKIISPKVFGSIELGETFVGEKREVIGKSIKTNVMNLGQGGYRRQNIEVGFAVTGLHDEKGITEFRSYQIIPSAIKRMIRRGKNKIEDSFIVKTADNKMLKIKPLLVTRSQTTASVQTVLRKTMRRFIASELAKRNLDDFAKELVAHRFQKLMYDVGSKVHPLSTCEVRWAQVTTENKPAEKVEKKVEAKKEDESEESPVVKAEEQKAELSDKQKEEVKEASSPEPVPAEETPVEKPAAEEQKEAEPEDVNLSEAQKTSKSKLSEAKESA